MTETFRSLNTPTHLDDLTSVSIVAVLMLLLIGFVVVMCVISEAAGKAVDRQKGKAVVRQSDRQTDRQFDRKAVRRVR